VSGASTVGIGGVNVENTSDWWRQRVGTGYLERVGENQLGDGTLPKPWNANQTAGIFRASLTFIVGNVEKIRSAAIRERSGRITEGANHKEIRQLILASTYEAIKGTEGFVTTSGRFVGRKEAVGIALASGQAETIADETLGLSSSDMVYDFPIYTDPLPEEETDYEFL
jgi:hypothetical protein